MRVNNLNASDAAASLHTEKIIRTMTCKKIIDHSYVKAVSQWYWDPVAFVRTRTVVRLSNVKDLICPFSKNTFSTFGMSSKESSFSIVWKM